MTRRILLHVGSPKCGSTYLQRVMLQNRDLLKKQRVHYPHDGSDHPGNAAQIKDIDPNTLLGYFEGDIHTTILSYEDLYATAELCKPLAKLCREHDIAVQLIVFLRPFSEFVYGDYSQFMKQFFEQFLAKRSAYDGQDFKTFAYRRIERMQPAEFLDDWRKLFPELPMIMERHQNIQTLIEQLLGPDLVNSLDWDVDIAKVNPSLRMEDCDRIAKAMQDPDITDDAIREMLYKAFQQAGQDDAGKTPERTAWLEKKFAPHNAALLKEFGFDNYKKIPPSSNKP